MPGNMLAQKKINEARRLSLNSGCALRLSFLTLPPRFTVPVLRSVSGNNLGSRS